METIAIDIDDVISPFTEAFINYHNVKYRTNLSLDDFKVPGNYWGFYEGVLTKIFNDEENVVEYRRRFIEYLNSDHHIRGQPIDDRARTTIAELKKHYDLQIITARDGSIKQGTIDWINKEFPNTFSAIHFSTTGKDPVAHKTKAEICYKIGASYLIDDSIDHCNSSAARGVKSLLFGNYGWNIRGELHNNVIRLTDWDSVYLYFSQKKVLTNINSLL